MWAGSRLRSDAPLRIGDRLTRRSEVVSLTPKIGSSGRLLFITLRHILVGSSGGGVVEEQDIVLREPAGRSASQATRPRRLPSSSSMW
jgi:3-methylfumaryl-CoA hydratase